MRRCAGAGGRVRRSADGLKRILCRFVSTSLVDRRRVLTRAWILAALFLAAAGALLAAPAVAQLPRLPAVAHSPASISAGI